jgi:hypothetical protein
MQAGLLMQTEQLRTEVDLADKRFPSIRRQLSCFLALGPFKDAYEQKNESKHRIE